MKLQPREIVTVRRPGYSHAGEVMSYPTPDHTVMVRMVPGHPGTLKEIPIKDLGSIDRVVEVHYASIRCVFGRQTFFPVDALRYDFAAPVNFEIDEDYRYTEDPSFGLNGLWIATATIRGLKPWTVLRWRSFGWDLEPATSEAIYPK